MSETQNIEYKSSWHDDYLKWICGFANAQGGRIYVGKDDTGKIVGVEDYQKLMDEIPNKIKNLMGITAEINLLLEEDKHFIEIIVSPYSVPISLRGRYYYRSGSVKQELTGNSLNEFLLKKSGQTWDNVIEPRATFADIDEKSVKAYLVMSKEKGKITNSEYQTINDISERTASRELSELAKTNVLEQAGSFGAGSYYQLKRHNNANNANNAMITPISEYEIAEVCKYPQNSYRLKLY